MYAANVGLLLQKLADYDYNPYEDIKNLLVEVPIETISNNSYSLNYTEYLIEENTENMYEDGIEIKKLGDVCKEYTLKLHPQFCTLFKNQLSFNKELNNFIRKLDANDLLVFFSDYPPLYSRRDRIHFEDYIDVFFFKKQ